MKEKLVIIGGGMAAGYLLSELIKSGYSGNITYISDEPIPPYHRPPLSKTALEKDVGTQQLLIKPESFYRDQTITSWMDKLAIKLDAKKKEVVLNTGETITFDRAVLATGSRLRRIEVPGESLQGVHYLKTLEDAIGLRESMAEAKNVAIVGGGVIGIEVAALASKLGKSVTVIERGRHIMARMLTPSMADYLKRIHERRGISFMLGETVEEIAGNERVEKIVCSNKKEVDADLVLVGIGVIPNESLARRAGIFCGDGIHVDATGSTNIHDIYAIGDCAQQYHSLLGQQVRLESVHNAMEQAKTVASSLMGKPCQNQTMPWFWSDQAGLKLQIVGYVTGRDKVITLNETSPDSACVAYTNNGMLTSVLTINNPKLFMGARKLLSNGPVAERELDQLLA